MLIILIFGIITTTIYYFIFNKKPDLAGIIFAIILFIAVYIYFKIIVPKYLLNQPKN
jgi:hypothetical protein